MSGTQESITYHESGQLPSDSIVASQEQLTAAAEEKAAEELQEEVERAIIRNYTNYPTSDKIAVSLICSPPMSLDSSKRERIAVFEAKDAAYKREVIDAYKAYCEVKGRECIC